VLCKVTLVPHPCEEEVCEEYEMGMEAEESGNEEEMEMPCASPHTDKLSRKHNETDVSDLSVLGLDNNVAYFWYTGSNCTFNITFWNNDDFGGARWSYRATNRHFGNISLPANFTDSVSSYKLFLRQ